MAENDGMTNWAEKVGVVRKMERSEKCSHDVQLKLKWPALGQFQARSFPTPGVMEPSRHPATRLLWRIFLSRSPITRCAVRRRPASSCPSNSVDATSYHLFRNSRSHVKDNHHWGKNGI